MITHTVKCDHEGCNLSAHAYIDYGWMNEKGVIIRVCAKHYGEFLNLIYDAKIQTETQPKEAPNANTPTPKPTENIHNTRKQKHTHNRHRKSKRLPGFFIDKHW